MGRKSTAVIPEWPPEPRSAQQAAQLAEHSWREGRSHRDTHSILPSSYSRFPSPCSASGWLLPRSLLTPSHPPNDTQPCIRGSTPGSLCQNAFPHGSPCLPSHSPHTCAPQKKARSILNACSCPPSVSSGEPNVETWKPMSGHGPTMSSEPCDNQGILPMVGAENSPLASSWGCWSIGR